MNRRKILLTLGATAGSLAILPLLPAVKRAAWAAEVEVMESDSIMGDPEAPLTIVEYASLTCSHCADFHNNTLPEVKANWLETGKARLVFRHFPLDGIALRAASVAECLEGQRKFAFISALFQNQSGWARAEDPIAAIGQVAKVAGMNQATFESCVADEAAMNEIIEGAQKASREFGVESTPTFLIEGRKVAGALPYEKFNEVLEEAASS